MPWEKFTGKATRTMGDEPFVSIYTAGVLALNAAALEELGFEVDGEGSPGKVWLYFNPELWQIGICPVPPGKEDRFAYDIHRGAKNKRSFTISAALFLRAHRVPFDRRVRFMPVEKNEEGMIVLSLRDAKLEDGTAVNLQEAPTPLQRRAYRSRAGDVSNL